MESSSTEGKRDGRGAAEGKIPGNAGTGMAKQQDIIWVRFPYSDFEEAKFRPAVVVSNNDYNKENPDVAACAITSNLDEKDYSILIDESNIAEGKLPLKSKIRADKIMQIEKTIISKAFARLDDKTFDLTIVEIMKLVKRGK